MVNKEEYRKKIIVVSGQIFSRYGFKKTTMEDVARASGKGKSSIYYYFKSKEDIFKNVLEINSDISYKHNHELNTCKCASSSAG